MGNLQQQALSLLDSHGSQLYRLLFKMTLRADVAEDLLQELFVSLANSKAWGHASDPAAYAFRVAINLACRWRRRNPQLKALPAAEEKPSPALSVLEGLVRREESELALQALAGLSELARECLVRRYLHHESTESIAGQLGKTAHQVRALCSKGLAELRQRMKTTESEGRSNAIP